jgi:hypothetical protein
MRMCGHRYIKVKLSRYTPWKHMEWEEVYSSCSFLTLALDGGEWSASRPGRALPPGKGPPVPIVQEAGWTPESVWTQRLEEKSSACVGEPTPVVQSVVRHYTAWATPALGIYIYMYIYKYISRVSHETSANLGVVIDRLVLSKKCIFMGGNLNRCAVIYRVSQKRCILKVNIPYYNVCTSFFGIPCMWYIPTVLSSVWPPPS